MRARTCARGACLRVLAASIQEHLGRFQPGGRYQAMVLAGKEYIVVDLRAPQTPQGPAFVHAQLMTVTFSADFCTAHVHREHSESLSVRVGGV
jgi:hypothetical protein